MKFGLWYAAVGPFAFSNGAVKLARAAETAGIESLWSGEHVAVPADYRSTYPYSDDGKMAGRGAVPMAEPFVWAAFIAAQTRVLRLVTGVLVLPQREPVLVAKQAATLAVLSGERFSLGVGAGWLKEEFAALGADFSSRTQRMEAYVAAMRVLWASDKASFNGDYVAFEKLQMSPRPPSGRVPIVVGGHTQAAACRAGRFGDGFFPAKGTRDELARLFDVVRRTAAEHGRDPETIEFTVADRSIVDASSMPAIAAWREIGVQRILVNPPSFDPNAAAEGLARFGEEVIAHADS